VTCDGVACVGVAWEGVACDGVADGVTAPAEGVSSHRERLFDAPGVGVS